MPNGSPLAARATLNLPLVIAIIVAMIVVLAIIYILSQQIHAYLHSPAYLESLKTRPTSSKNINEIAKEASLIHEEKMELAAICKRHPVPNITYAIHDPKNLEPYYKESFAELNRQLDETGKANLFSLRTKIKNVFTPVETFTNTYKIELGTIFTYTASQGVHYRLRLVEKNPDSLILELPAIMVEKKDLPKEMSKIELVFISQAGNAFRMLTRVFRFQKGKDGSYQMIVTHSDQLTALTKRSGERRDVEEACKFASVTISTVKSGRKTRIEYHPSLNMHDGTILDVSIGGCRITSNLPIKAEQLIYVHGKLNSKQEDIIIGQIVKTTKRLDGLFILHIKFIKIDLPVINRIQAFVCKYDTEITTAKPEPATQPDQTAQS